MLRGFGHPPREYLLRLWVSPKSKGYSYTYIAKSNLHYHSNLTDLVYTLCRKNSQTLQTGGNKGGEQRGYVVDTTVTRQEQI